MSPGDVNAIEYVQARRVLLDAIETLGELRRNLVLVGAQAVYLRTAHVVSTQPLFTIDADLALDPRSLGTAPVIAEAMARASFRRNPRRGDPQTGVWWTDAPLNGIDAEANVDFLVPAAFAPPGREGRRSVILPPHGKVGRRTNGLEPALVDRDPFEISALDPSDSWSFVVEVAGAAALLVAKSHKITERLGNPGRLRDKDAADIYRLIIGTKADDIASAFAGLLRHPIAGDATRLGLTGLTDLFARRGSPGIVMAARALEGAVPRARIEAVLVGLGERVASGSSSS